MDETKRITTAFQDKAAGAGSIEAIQCDLDNIEKAFTDCNEELAAMEMPDCGYCFQGEAILEMTENLRALFIYVGCAHPHVSEVLDFPLYTDFKSNATESLSHIVLDDIRTDNTFGMEEHVEVNDAGYLRVDSRVKEDLGFSDFFGITDIRPQDGYPVLENVETVGEFASLFRADYDRMKPEGMDINTFLEGYLTYGEYEHTGYHPVRDFLSGLADVTIIIPVIDAILGKDIITGETLNDFERGMKAAGAAIDLFTLGQAMVLAGGVEAGAGIIVKTLAVEMVSNAAGYSAGYAANEMGMPLPVTWILSVATGCTVSATVGGYLFTSADGTITKCTPEEAGDLIKRLDKTDSPASFADMMSPEDAARYLRFLENGSTEGLTSAELEGIKKVDELLALKKISYQDVLDIRNSGKALESGSSSVKNNLINEIKDIRGEMSTTNLAKRGNMAVADVDIPGIKDNFVAHSKINAEFDKGADVADFSYLKPENERIFTTYVDDQYPRYHDTEAKILEDIASQITDSNVSGTINLYSELPCCQSCSNIILEFRRKFPNIKLNVYVE